MAQDGGVGRGFDVRGLIRPEIAQLEAYTPIQPFEVLSKRLGIPAHAIVKLDANENPYGPAPAVVEALAEYTYYHIYPDPSPRDQHRPTGQLGIKAVHAKRGWAVDDGVARSQKETAQVVEQLIRAVTGQDIGCGYAHIVA